VIPCHDCACRVVPGSEPVAPVVRRPGLLAVVTDAPSGAESLGRGPFVGASGEVLLETIKAVSAFTGTIIDDIEDHITIFHAIARPTPGGKPPRIADVRTCRDRLMAELDAARPRAVLSVGASGCASLSGAKTATPITAWRGQMRWLELPTAGRIPWVATISAGSVVARPDLYRDLVADIYKIWTQEVPLPEPIITII
jgi:uracil-DNA glycosylase family 4